MAIKNTVLDAEVIVRTRAARAELRRFGGAGTAAANSIARGFGRVEKRVHSFGSLLGAIMTSKVISRGFAYAEMGIASLGETIITADQALTSASAKFGDSVKRGNSAYKELQRMGMDVAGTTEFTLKQVAEGYDFLAMAGFNYQQTLKAIKPLTDLATASQMDLARASDIASDALGAFQLSMDPKDIEKNLNRVNDVFAKAVTSRNVTMETLFDTMKHGGSAVATGGGDVETFAALAGEMGGAGIKGTKAGTTLKNMYVNLSVAAAKAGTAGGKALRELGIEFRDPKNKKNLADVVGILEQLDKKTRDLGDIKKTKIIKDIFGKIALPGVKSLLSPIVIGRLREYRDTMYDAAGASKKMAAEMRTGLGSQLKILKSAAMAKGMEVFTKVMGGEDPVDAVKMLIKAVRGFKTDKLANELKSIFQTVKGIAKVVIDNKDLLFDLGKIYLAGKLAMPIAGAIGSAGKFLMTRGAVAAGSAAAGSVGSAIGAAGGAAGAAGGAGFASTAVGAMAPYMAMTVPLVITGLAAYGIGKIIDKKILEPERKREQKAATKRNNEAYVSAHMMNSGSLEELRLKRDKFKENTNRMSVNPWNIDEYHGKLKDLNRLNERITQLEYERKWANGNPFLGTTKNDSILADGVANNFQSKSVSKLPWEDFIRPVSKMEDFFSGEEFFGQTLFKKMETEGLKLQDPNITIQVHNAPPGTTFDASWGSSGNGVARSEIGG